MSDFRKIWNKEEEREISLFLEAFNSGRVCVHPTDTIPGLCCNPFDAEAVASLQEVKKRAGNKVFVGLVPSLEVAKTFWKTLPSSWELFLSEFWPGPLTFLWEARKTTPDCFVSDKGELALRYPKLREDSLWFFRVMLECKGPVPSTSINYGGEPPRVRSKDIFDFQKETNVYISKIWKEPQGASKPSSLIRILDEKNYEFLREGAVSKSQFSQLWSSFQS